MPVHSISTQHDLKQAIAHSETKPIVIDCDATWCEPCRAINPVFNQFASEERFSDTIDFYRLDADTNDAKDFMERMGIRVLPTFVFYKDGEVLKQFRGASPLALERILSEVVDWVEKGGPTPAP